MATTTLKLFCLMNGEPMSNTFKVKFVDTNADVADLQKAIIEEVYWQKTPANSLVLWRATIPTNENVGGETVIKLDDLDDLDKTKLDKPRTSLSKLFPEGPDENTYIVFERPIASKRGQEPEPDTSEKHPRILGATSVSKTRIFQTTDEESSSEQTQQIFQLPQDHPNILKWRTIAGTIFADKSPYIEELEKEVTNYRYVFLRPPRSGKSAFLNLLCAYYDVHNSRIFDKLFGPLYIGKNPTACRNKHLVLKFDLSSISVSGSVDKMETSFNAYINDALRQFLQKYNSELGHPEENKIIVNGSGSQSLDNILYLVGTQGQSLFVGVDEYDAPVNNSAFAGGNTELGKDILGKVRLIESFFKENFFAILKKGCSAPNMNDCGVIISKYFLTGVTPAFLAGISPLTATAIVSNRCKLYGICGFTESEVKAMVKIYLRLNDQDAEPLVHSMKPCNGYRFALSSYDESNSAPLHVYNPHLVLHYLSNFQSEGFVAMPEKSTTIHSTRILKSISDVGEFSVNDLVELIVSKSIKSRIKTEFGYSELLSVGKDREVTWSLLYYLGILTLNPDGSLRVPNDIAKSEVLGRITAFLRTQDKISALMVPAIGNIKMGKAEEFCELLETFFSSQAVRSLQMANEAVLQGIVELLLDEARNRIPELCLVVDGSKEHGEGRFGFVDIFIPSQAIGNDQTCVVMELKNVTLDGLWMGMTGRNPSHKELESLRENLQTEDARTLLLRKYTYWSQEDRKWATVTLQSIREAGVKQLRQYMQTIAQGKARSYGESGVLDGRIKIDAGHNELRGYVVMAIEGVRVLVFHMENIQTEWEYVRDYFERIVSR